MCIMEDDLAKYRTSETSSWAKSTNHSADSATVFSFFILVRLMISEQLKLVVIFLKFCRQHLSSYKLYFDIKIM